MVGRRNNSDEQVDGVPCEESSFIHRFRFEFSSGMPSTNTPDQAADLYREASKIPRSVTQVELAQQHISIGQLFPDAASSKTAILEAFDGGSRCPLKVESSRLVFLQLTCGSIH